VAEIDYFAPAIFTQLPRGRSAVIEASAGTGKTHAIAHLVFDLLLNSELKIEQILVVTFTERATTELRAKIRRMLERVARGAPPDEAREGEPRTIDDAGRRRLADALFGFAGAPVFTIHAFCMRVLAELGFDSGMPPALELIDGRREFHRAFCAELRENFAVDEAALAILRAWLAQEKNHAIDALEDRLAQAARRRASELLIPAAAGTDELERSAVNMLLPAVVARMERDKRARGVLDYDDMLAWTWRALSGVRGDALAAAIRERYRAALVDEFQDTDDLQWRILRRIFIDDAAGGAAYLIGDPKQAIYAFRGADVHAYLAARAELVARGVEPVALTQNFRSTAAMIDALNLIFRQDAAAPFFTGAITYHKPAECARRDLAVLDAGRNPIVPVTLLECPRGANYSAARANEAIGRSLAAALRRLIDDPFVIRSKRGERRLTAGDIHVLTRTLDEGGLIGGYLRDAGVPFAFYKQEGLFETSEAAEILDVLRAVLDPADRSARLKAWATQFFAIRFEDLWTLGEVDAAHPLMARLLRWHALAAAERFGELFDDMLHSTGLVERELMLANSERELTNYQHILELLLKDALAERLSLEEISGRLAAYIAERALPPGEDSAVMRLESERPAVQVMTIHKSKGLEADVVAVFCGPYSGHGTDAVSVFHDGLERRLAIGKRERDRAKAQLDREELEEDQRLFYVALTRARARLYLPLFPEKSLTKRAYGSYKPLNERLLALRDEQALDPLLFEFTPATAGAASADSDRAVAQALREWSPPERSLATGDAPGAPRFDALRQSHAAFALHSYTTLTRRDESIGVEPEDFKSDFGGGADVEPDLPGGRNVGLFLHELIEKLDMDALAGARDVNDWQSSPEVRELIDAAMRRHRVRDQRWRERGAALVYNTLTAPLSLGDTIARGGLARCPSVREMEFVFPIPERWHPLLKLAAPPADSRWTAERGFLSGFVDFVFRLNGLTYFADWKSDLLRSYEPAAIEEHVRRNYDLQARIYSVGVVRLLGISNQREYRERFGGLVYVFLRGIEARGGARGIYFHRPEWDELTDYEQKLGALAGDAEP
jgi:exodeoxyribonuclease V beta subunit